MLPVLGELHTPVPGPSGAWSPGPPVSAAPPPQVSPWPAQHLHQQAASAATGFTCSLPPSWNQLGFVAILILASVIFSFSSEPNFDVEADSFPTSYKENFELIYGTYHLEFFQSL